MSAAATAATTNNTRRVTFRKNNNVRTFLPINEGRTLRINYKLPQLPTLNLPPIKVGSLTAAAPSYGMTPEDYAVWYGRQRQGGYTRSRRNLTRIRSNRPTMVYGPTTAHKVGLNWARRRTERRNNRSSL